jgi:hypothetical protein
MDKMSGYEGYSRFLAWFMATLLVALAAGCGSGTTNFASIAVTPSTASIPIGGTQQFVATGTSSAGTTFDISNTATWTSNATAVATVVTPGVATGVSTGTATITATSGGNSGSATLTVTTAQAQAPVFLGQAGTFAIAATAGVAITNTVSNTTINGNVVLDPIATCNAVAVNVAGGFGLCGGALPILNGQVSSPLFPDAGVTSGAVKAALQAAFLSITPPAGPPTAGLLGGATPILAGTILGAPTGSALAQGSNLFVPGIYQSVTSILITGDLTLDAQGDPNANFIFQSSSTVGTADGLASPGVHTRILLINNARASNVFWQAGTSARLGAFSEFQGNILASANITMVTGATSCGRLFAGAFLGGAFVLDSNVVSVPGIGC